MKSLVIFICCATFANARIFQCVFGTQSWMYIGDEVYSCIATISFYGNPSVLEDVLGNHMARKNLSDVEGLIVAHQKLGQIPTNLEEFFPNLKGVDFSNSELLMISSADLKVLPNIVWFRVWKNQIISIDSDLFKHNPDLQYIDFDANWLQNVGFNLLGELRNLRLVEFNQNPCISTFASTPMAIYDLNIQLSISCPPLDTTTTELITQRPTTTQFPEECSVRCTLGDETDELRREVANLNYKVKTYEERLSELEKQMREIWANPGFQSSKN